MGGEGAVAEHWRRPIARSPALSATALLPKTCGACHRSQLRDWSGSLHSKSMGPGLLFQLNPQGDPETATACYFCHAPLSIQSEILFKDSPSSWGEFVENKDFNGPLKATGVSCGVCHARGVGISGPTSPKLKGLASGVKADHASTQEGFFEKAEFCAACHQLKDGFRINGKLLVNTYAEWKESAFGEAGITCQKCHMPDRRHLFRGIHDPAMARSGIKVEVTVVKGSDGAAARLTITNTGAGHKYPTYTTPLIIVKGYLVDAKGAVLKNTSREAYIGRKIALDLSEEFFDTRIAPLGSFTFDYPLKDSGVAKKLVFKATVYPDEFYNRFYKYYLGQESTGRERRELEAAYKNSSTSAYELFRKEIPLKEFVLKTKNKL